MTTVTSTHQLAPRVTSRAPWPLHLAAVLMTLAALVTSFGALWFGTHPDPIRPAGAPAAGSWQAWVLIAVLIGYALAALACVPGLYRRSRTAWGVALGYAAAEVLFSSLKVFGLGESAAGVFLAVNLVIAAGLLAPATRRHLDPPGGVPTA